MLLRLERTGDVTLALSTTPSSATRLEHSAEYCRVVSVCGRGSVVEIDGGAPQKAGVKTSWQCPPSDGQTAAKPLVFGHMRNRKASMNSL